MSEWWTYGLHDFLMFAPATYQRLFALYNAQVWPAQVLALPLGVLAGWWLARRSTYWRAACGLLALGWLWTAWAFHWRQYAAIHTAAPCFAWAFAWQGVVLAWIARPGSRWQLRTAGAARIAGLGLWGFALLLQPGVELLPGQPWQQAALFGLTPDATAVGTLGLLLLLRRPGPGAWQAGPWLLPLLWCAISSATLWTLALPHWWLPAAAAALALVVRSISGRNPEAAMA